MARRPTIPLHDWRIAVHLEGTRHVQQYAGMPSTGCECDNCLWWRRICHELMPEGLREQLPRFGIDIERPNDVHPNGAAGQPADFYVRYHTVGKILQTATKDGRKNAVIVQTEPVRVTLDVVDSAKEFFYTPDIPDQSWGDVLCFSFWFLGVERDRLAPRG